MLGLFEVGNPEGLWWLLGLVPLILLYLIRPRPKPLAIPSLMFFLRSSGSRRLNSFLRQITHDWLFLIQLLLLLALLFTFANPFTKYEHDVTSSNTVIVLDVSASMQTSEGSQTRFDIAVSKAKKVLGAKNTIILAKDVPFIALQDSSADETIKFLNSLSPKETSSHIGEAVILAGETLGEGRVVVLSDFINTAGQDPLVAKGVVESKGIVVDFVDVGSEDRSNIGIIRLDAGNDDTSVYVKNYDKVDKNVGLSVGSSKVMLAIPSLSTETYSFKTPPGINKIELAVNDDLYVDNVAFLSAPAKGKAKVLLVSNIASPFLKNALSASGDFDVVVTEPPVIEDGNFDVIIINNVDISNLLPGTFEDFYALAEKGASVIVAVQSDSDKIDFKGLVPFKLNALVEGGFVDVEQLNSFTKNIDFGRAENIFACERPENILVVSSVNKVPVITIKPVGSGKLVFYGLPDGEFIYSPSYPIFWTELLKFVTDQQDVKNLNFKSGDTLILDEEQVIQTPSKKIKRAALVFDEAGVYQLTDRSVAVNLIDEAESDINGKPVGTKSVDYELRPVKETREFHLTIWLLAIALFFLIFEVFFVKYRGEV